MNFLNITNLSKSYGKKVLLKNVSLKCKTGEIIGIFGRNGTGKSTLLKLIFGTLKADFINLKINNKYINPNTIIASKKVAYLPQQSFLPKELTVRKIIPLMFTSGEDQDKIFYKKGIASFEKIPVGKLSIGQLRYLELLLIGNLKCDFLLLDEPFSMIEPLYKDIIAEHLLELKKDKGILLTDHYYDDVLKIADKNFVLKEGKLHSIKNETDLIKYNYLNRVD